MTTKRNIEADLAFAGQLADAAWTAIQPHFRCLTSVSNKSDGQPGPYDPVTEADTAAERAMRDLIEAQKPQDGVLGEEFPETSSASGWTWVLDPIDGTRAFVAGLPVWTTLIALCDPDGDPQLGIINQPVVDERYLGWPGHAALEQAGARTPIRVSQCSELSQAKIATTDPFILLPEELTAWRQLSEAAQITRYGLDAYAYGRLADGTIDLVAESELAPWDAAALIAVVRGAGGLATDWTGQPARPGGQLVCASSQSVLDQALDALRVAATQT
jgi:histidinol phosphatase-like enzyme (inositol monophosphatase family)